MNTTNTPRRLNVLAGLSVLGIIFSAVLSKHFYEVRSGAAGFKSFCNINSSMNCDVIAASPYAELFAGIPLSSFAGGWFVALFIVSLLARNPLWRRESLRAALALTGIGTLFSLGYLAVMALVLKTFCLYCLGIDVVTLAALAVVLSMKPEGLGKSKLDGAQWKTFAMTTLGSLVVTIVAFTIMGSEKVDRGLMNDMVASVLNTNPVSINVTDDQPTIGPKDAPITIVEFSDFQCPHCRNGAMIMHSVLNRFPTQVKLVHRNYPFDPACNRLVQHSMHPAACEAARAVTCGNKQGKFQAVFETIFENQSKLAPGKPVELAKDAGVDAAQFDACMSAPETAQAVVRDLEEGEALGVRSTPTFFINGRKVEGAYPVEVWVKVIETLLKK